LVKNVSTIAVALATAATLRSISAVRMTKVSERRRRDAEEADEDDQRRERRDVAQLIAQDAAEVEPGGLGAKLGHVYLLPSPNGMEMLNPSPVMPALVAGIHVAAHAFA
jgi:hypothetical protein